MRIARFVSASVVVITFAASHGSVAVAGQSGAIASVTAVPSPPAATLASVTAVPTPPAESAPTSAQFATLARVKAVTMSSGELDAVKGLHVHFDDAAAGINIHLAGDVNTMNNWTNLGGSDGQPVAPSYHGLCVAQGVGVGGISIPGAAVQCP